MNKEIQSLRRSDLMSLEEYAERRNDFRTQVMAHKKNRQVALGPNSRLYFEDRTTMQYQIQEILRIEKIFESAASTPEQLNQSLFAIVQVIPNRHIFSYKKGVWN